MSLPLARVVAATDALRATRSRTAKRDLLAELLGATDPAEAEILVGLLLASVRQGRVGVGWRTLRAAAEATSPAPSATLTLGEVDVTLERLSRLDGPGSAARRADLLGELLSRATPAERDLLVAALTGDLRTGALSGVLTDALAAATRQPVAEVRRAVMLTGSAGRTARLLLADPDAVHRVTLTVGTPVQPMLAATATGIADAMSRGGLVSVEHKLDGARIQVHRTGDEVRVFTRTLADITDRVPEIVALVRGFPAQAFILDGETLALNAEGAPRPFQETMSRFGSHTDTATLLAPRFFDVLHLDGTDLLDVPLVVRIEALEGLVGPHRVTGRLTDDAAVGEQVLAEALALGHEGVMVKDADSPYAAGRRGTQWRKVKPVHTLDLVVLAAEWGYGRREGWLSNLHLGARAVAGPSTPAGRSHDAPGSPVTGRSSGESVGHRAPRYPDGWVMVGKTFKGLTDALLRWQTGTFPAAAVAESRGTVWLHPTFVVEVAVDGVQRSSRYPGGVALRFARVKRYRPDKTPEEADTIDAVRALRRD